MSHHHHHIPRIDVKAGVVVCSDRASRGEYEDKVIPTVKEIFAELGWQLIFTSIVPDNIEDIRKAAEEGIKAGVHVIFTAGGTGVSPRDVTPEAIKPLIAKELPGIAEYMRYISWSKTPHALLSRAVAGISQEGVIIITLPGSPKASREIIPALKDAIMHAIPIIQGYKIE
ncbi:MAG: MogA/MoaB family molybdenum cofactor biosynthesis protein [Dictyoglomi bacterium]|nr:MogA/MoaB family molybdenum cofactor biosynthesis protein [Dictyoglomota bacterium]